MKTETKFKRMSWNDKMKFLEQIHVEVFGKPKEGEPEWEHDSTLQSKYLEPYNIGVINSRS